MEKEKMFMQKIKKMIPYLAVLLITFYLLPLCMRDAGIAMILMLIVMPLICLVCSLMYGFKQGFYWIYPIAAAALFTPTIWIYYNSSAWVYILVYAGAALIGDFVGMISCRCKAK